MREKLIQILKGECDDFGITDAGDDSEFIRCVMFDMSRGIRCDNCKHFRESPEAKQEGACDTGPASHAMFIRPDFFCALFEEK